MSDGKDRTWRLSFVLKGAAGVSTVPANPETFKAKSVKEALEILAEANLPDNDLVTVIGVSLKSVDPVTLSADEWTEEQKRGPWWRKYKPVQCDNCGFTVTPVRFQPGKSLSPKAICYKCPRCDEMLVGDKLIRVTGEHKE